MRRKKHFNSLRGPGAYIGNLRDISFNILAKKEQHQFFNSTTNRFAGDFIKKTAEDEAIRGPGSYDVVKNAFSRSVSHNRTFTAAFLSKWPENMFGIKDIPGP